MISFFRILKLELSILVQYDMLRLGWFKNKLSSQSSQEFLKWSKVFYFTYRISSKKTRGYYFFHYITTYWMKVRVLFEVGSFLRKTLNFTGVTKHLSNPKSSVFTICVRISVYVSIGSNDIK